MGKIFMSMKGLIIIVALIISGDCLVVQTPPDIAGVVFPHWQYVSQYFAYPVTAPFWNKNYSLSIIGDGCSSPPQGTSLSGQIGVFLVATRDLRCFVTDSVANWSPTNPTAFLWADYQGISMWGGWNPYRIPPNDIPIFVTSFSDQRTAIINDYFTNSAVLFSAFENITVLLDSPSPVPYMQKALYPGTDQFVRWFGVTLALIAMNLSIWKLSAFVQYEGGVKTSIPQMVLFFSFLSGLFLLLYFMVWGGSLNPEAISPYDAWEGVYWCPAGFYYTALIILGFYLGEISRLTSSQGVPGLSLMKIPAIVFIVVTWCILISEMVTTAADGTGLDSVNNTMLFSFFFAWIGVILPFAVSAVLAWGVISLLRSLGSAQGSKLRFFRIIAIVLFAIACMWTFLLVNALMFYIPGDFLDRMGSLQWNLLLWDYYWLRDLMYLLGVALPLICVILNFQISVQKEIELSKSGTSSTSSASSSSSSSSSSSQNDPVIEL